MYLWIYLNSLLTWHKRRFVNFQAFYWTWEHFATHLANRFEVVCLFERTSSEYFERIGASSFHCTRNSNKLTSKINIYDWNLKWRFWIWMRFNRKLSTFQSRLNIHQILVYYIGKFWNGHHSIFIYSSVNSLCPTSLNAMRAKTNFFFRVYSSLSKHRPKIWQRQMKTSWGLKREKNDEHDWNLNVWKAKHLD